MTSVTLSGNPAQTVGKLPAIGEVLPSFELCTTDLKDVSSEDFAGKRLVLSIFPSVDTGTCAVSVRRFNKEAAALENTVVLCISEDLPFAQDRFCGAEGIENVTVLSAFRSSFGEDFGVRLLDTPLKGLLSRAVVVTDAEHKVIYTEQVPEISEEPDYEAALRALGSQN